MAALRAGDQLVNQTTPTSYGWPDILIEQLAISRDEYRLFTDPALQLGDLYGLPGRPRALADLQAMSLQDLSRRLGVSYDDLSAIVADPVHQPERRPHPAAAAAQRAVRDAAGAARHPEHAAVHRGQLHQRPARRARRHPVRRHQPDRLPGGGGLGHRARRLPADHGHHHDQRPRRDHRRLLRRQPPAPLLQPGQHRQPAQRHGLPEAHPLHPALAQARARCSATPATRRRSSTPTTSSRPSTRPRDVPGGHQRRRQRRGQPAAARRRLRRRCCRGSASCSG